MDENLRYAVGLDVGTSHVRAVIASVNKDGACNVVGFGEQPNSGMRKGVVANLDGPFMAIDKVLAEIEPMSGFTVKSAAYSINGTQVMSTRTEGMIAVGTTEHAINQDDLERVREVALRGRVPANQRILDVIPLQYVLDGQRGIKDPFGMTGARLEMQANVISTLAPSYDNLVKVAEKLNVQPDLIMPSAVASARAVLSERQVENGVVLIDIGATTTGVAVYEEGDLQYVGVVPLGSNNITNDLAMLLAVDTEVAEEIKRRFATGDFGEIDKPVILKWRGEEMSFPREQVDAAVRVRLMEIFGLVRQKLWEAHYERKLPEGAVLTGGGAKMRGLTKFARESLEMSVKLGRPVKVDGVANEIYAPEYAAAVGLMFMSVENVIRNGGTKHVEKKAHKKEGKMGFWQKLLGRE